MNARSRLHLSWCALLWLALCGAACTVNHEAPQGGTETGNPPLVDAARIALVIDQDALHMRGKSGAVSPGADIEVVSLLTGAVFRGRAEADGSFDVAVDASAADTFEVRALSAGRSSSTVHVVLGGASVGEDEGQKLSCKQREQLANAHMHATSDVADTACERDADCVLAPVNTLCNDACYDAPVSTGGARELQEARQAIEAGLCKDFSRDGCSFLALPCAPPTSTTVGCRAGRCQLVEPDAQSSADCSSPLDPGTGTQSVTAYWRHLSGACIPFTYKGTGGNGNRYPTREACEAACPLTGECPPNRLQTSFCVAPGLAGGCAEMATGCALLCAEAGQPCDDEQPGWWCSGRNLCEGSSPE